MYGAREIESIESIRNGPSYKYASEPNMNVGLLNYTIESYP